MANRRRPGANSPSPNDTGISTGSSPASSDNEGTQHAFRTSTEQAQYDQEVLDEEEEREKLLTGRASNPQGRGARRDAGRSRRSRHGSRLYNEDKNELMYDTEEGGRRSSTPSLSSSEEDREKIGYTHSRARKPSLCLTCCKYTCIGTFIAALFVAISLGAYKATRQDHHHVRPTFTSNGTHSFAPTTILLSLDGFRADFLQRGLTPTLNSFVREGVSPEHMLPSFPSVTFPNHYTLVTGLYPESHGVVGNSFWDPELREEFYYTDPNAMQAKWWHGEPLWVTAEEQGVRVATHMWPGSEAHIGNFEPTFVDKYNGSELLEKKVDTILAYLDKPGPDMLSVDTVVDDQRPQLIAAYVPNVDADGHKYGPNSTEIRDTIQAVDTMVGLLLEGLIFRNLTNIVNVVVVSDHGMATTSTNRTIQFEDLIDPDLIEHIDGWPHYGLRPKDPSTVDALYEQLLEKSKQMSGFDVYTKATMPPRYHFTANQRIAPLWLIPQTGWAIVQQHELDVKSAIASGEIYHPRGIHGYDHENPLMRAIFIARGPAFPHPSGSRVDVFQNTEVYNILCDTIGVTSKANNGTLRLPLKPSGLHEADMFKQGDLPDDPPATSTAAKSLDPTSAPTATNAAPDAVPTDDITLDRPTIDDAEDVQMAPPTWLEWMREKTARLKQWIHDQLGVDVDVEERHYQAPG